jgi:2-oxoglutarate dehydrogenase E1 component
VNNQLGSRPRKHARSRSGLDVAKMIQAPIFHVNGDIPRRASARRGCPMRSGRRSTRTSIDMVCYRRHGHNEGDDPSYTQPLMYSSSTSGVRCLLYTEAS